MIGKLPSRPLPKAIAEASLIAHIIVCKFIDHMPFYRQIQRFLRDYSWQVSDSTINEWFVAVCTLLHPLYEVLKSKVLESGYLQVDESPIKVLDQDNEKGVHQGYQWVYYAPQNKLVYFTYSKGRGQHGPKEVLSGYRSVYCILDYPQVELDNNLTENKIRPLALGRKNFMFAGSHSAAERIAMM